jgi:dienelactone hydrolase
VKKRIKAGFVFISISLALELLILIYSASYYRPDRTADKLIASGNFETEGGLFIFKPGKNNNHTGIVFYPGGKVDCKAYIPLLNKLRRRGYTVVMSRMPFNLAFFDINAYKTAFPSLKNVDKVYIMGHSLGGVAASKAFSGSGVFSGLILLGSYPMDSYRSEDILAIYGSNDTNMKPEKNPEKSTSYVIEGGNHAWFGNYGVQAGDGKADISHDKEQNEAVCTIVKFTEE